MHKIFNRMPPSAPVPRAAAAGDRRRLAVDPPQRSLAHQHIRNDLVGLPVSGCQGKHQLRSGAARYESIRKARWRAGPATWFMMIRVVKGESRRAAAKSGFVLPIRFCRAMLV